MKDVLRDLNYSRRPYYGHCFGCKQIGHRYTECLTTFLEDIAFIRENFDELLAEYNKQTVTAKNSTNLFALPPSTFSNASLIWNGAPIPYNSELVRVVSHILIEATLEYRVWTTA